MDYAVPSPRRPVLGRFNYEQLKSGSVRLGGREVPAAPLVSYAQSKRVAVTLKQWIEGGTFTLSEPAARLPGQGSSRPLAQKEPRPERPRPAPPPRTGAQRISWREELCFSCGQCLGICPSRVFRHDPGWRVTAEPERCTGCGLCDRVCPVGAITGEPNGR